MTPEQISSILNLMVVMATPLAFAGVGELYAERSGILNLGVEGIMLMGAFTSFYVAHETGNLLLAYLAGVAVGLALGLLMAFMSVSMRLNQVIAGMGIYFFGFGLSDFMYKTIYGTEYASIEKAHQIAVPLLSKIPIIGNAFFVQYPSVYLMYVLIPVMWYLLYRSRWGLHLRAVGENPRAADTLGVNVMLIRYLATVLGAALAGLAGAVLCVEITGIFFENLTFGMGFIAIGLVYFGRWDPLRMWAGTMLFGLSWSIAMSLQDYFSRIGKMHWVYFMLMIPYIVVLLALIAVSRKARAPAALSKPYWRETSE